LETSFLAFDLGAESGRAFVGLLQEERLLLDELDRFPNEMVCVSEHLHWDIHTLFIRIKKSISLNLREAASSHPVSESIPRRYRVSEHEHRR